MNNDMEIKESPTQRESFSELLGQLAKNSAAMVHDEFELAIQGIREKVRGVRLGILTVAAGAAIGFAAFLSLCAALIIGLSSIMSPVVAALIVGAALGVIGAGITSIGFKQLKKSLHIS